MPSTYVKKYFDQSSLPHKSQRSRSMARDFLATQLGIPSEKILIDEAGDIYIPSEGFNRLTSSPIDDTSFLEAGGRGAAIYEGVEMAFNDVMSEAVEVSEGKLLEPFHRLTSEVKKRLPISLKRVAAELAAHGAVEALLGFGAAAAAGLGLYLGFKGAKELNQGATRQDLNQAFSGGRHLALGVEAFLAGSTLASKLSGHAVAQTAASVAQAAATPFSFFHGVIDISQGVHQMGKAVRSKDLLAAAEGVAELGMGAGWMFAALGPTTPVAFTVASTALVTRLAISLLKSRRDKRKQEEAKKLEIKALEAMGPSLVQDREYELVVDRPVHENPLSLTAY